ncbi:hypothetical protein BJF89_16745 [Corynebacterium sp. CNJ-954]|uniref:hypothetical protein n=1 Tax=Corynebacterium sp. CNJ-954 TaxID=1904962 RepID=UPI00095C83DD|nr:hypothetical protein [Corynebacterium sp. CNJ-954]OLT54423.1 hypothetical protein BJF89_16745 [Corynebacterium sp. CNJ-954]
MGHITKKSLEAARQKFLRQNHAVIEAMAAVDEIEEQRSKIDEERETAIQRIEEKHSAKSRELDLELALAVATARESMPAKTVAADVGIPVSRQKELTALLEHDKAGDNTTTQSAGSAAPVEPETADTGNGERAEQHSVPVSADAG